MTALVHIVSIWLLLTFVKDVKTAKSPELSGEERDILTGDIILPENNGKLAGAQFIAEPDDLKDLEQSLPEIERGMIKEYNDPAKHLVPLHALRYISDQQGLKDIEKNIFQVYDPSSSQSLTHGMRYTHESDKVENINKDDANQLNQIMHFQNSELNSIASEGNKEQHSGGKSKGYSTQIKLHSLKAKPNRYKIENISDNNDALKYSKSKNYFPNKESATANAMKTLQNSHSSENPKRSKDTSKLYNLTMKNIKKKYYSRAIKNKNLKARTIANLGLKAKLSSDPSSVNTKIHQNKHTKKQSSSTNEIKRQVRESVKRDGVEDDGEDDEIKKRTSIFSDIATAFEHIKEDEESKKGKTKKSSLITPTRKDNENTDIKPVDGGFTPWTEWSECSETCGSNGIKMRMRVCTNPPPSNGGQDCKGWRFEVKYCKIPECEDNSQEVTPTAKPTTTVTRGFHQVRLNTISSIRSSVKDAKLHADKKEHNANLTVNFNGNDTISPSKSNEDNGEMQENNGTIQQNINKTLNEIDLQSNRSSENREIEKMFNEAVHEAFDSSKQKQAQKKHKEQESHVKVQKSFSPPNIHTDSGLILSENEIDTIDDAPDTSQEDNNTTIINNQTNQSVSQPESVEEQTTQSPLKSVSNSTNDSADKDVEDKKLNKTVDDELFKVAGEILKMNDSDAVLKALSSIKNTDMLENYSDASTNDKVSSNHNGSQGIFTKISNNDMENDVTDNEVGSNVRNNSSLSLATNHGGNDMSVAETPIESNGNKIEKSNQFRNGNKEQMSSIDDIKAHQKVMKKVSSLEQFSSTGDDTITDDTNHKTAEESPSSEKSDSEDNDSKIQLVDNDIKSDSDDNNNNNDGIQREDENVNESSDGMNDKGIEVNMKNTKTSAFENSFSSGSGDIEIEENPSNKSNNDDYDTVNLHALNALVEILAEHEKNESVKKNGSRKHNSTIMMKHHNSSLSPESGVHIKANTSSGNTNSSSFLTSKFLQNNTGETQAKNVPEYLNSGGAKVPKGNIVRNVNSSSSSISNGNNSTLSKDDVEEIFKTGMDMLRNYANGEGKQVNDGSSAETYELPIGKTASEKAAEALDTKDNAPKDGSHIFHNEKDMIHLKANISNGENHNTPYETNTPIDSDHVNSDLSTHVKESTADTKQRNETSKSSSTHKQKSRPSLFDVLKEVVSTFTKLSYALNNKTSEKNSTLNKDTTETTLDNSKEEARNSIKLKTLLSDDEKKRFSVWTGWTECSKSCGEGYKTRQRRCLSKEIDCTGVMKENRTCSVNECPVHGGFSTWSAWSPCSATCGTDVFKMRNRSCSNPVARFGGKPCIGAIEEKKICELKSCTHFAIAGKIGNQTFMPQGQPPKNEKGAWGPWSAWSKCSRSCGSDGFAKRERLCLPGKSCIGHRYDTKECGVQKCPVDGGYTEWTVWSPCTPTCGERAYKIRYRNCTNPPPQYGGKHCGFSSLETNPCPIKKCPVDGGFSKWSAWSSCSKTCNTTAFSRRERECNNPVPKYGGKPCVGKTTEIRNCGQHPCPIDGGVTLWSDWSKCPGMKCGSTFNQTRSRKCENPQPNFGGRNCTESLFEKRKCEPLNCPVNGGFSEWSAWSACPKECHSTASSHRKRTCNNPTPRNGGKPCTGEIAETRPCADIVCKVDGGFTAWSAWSGCSKECGHTSIRSRERYCTNPSPLNGGKPCKGSKIEISVCKADGCPRDGQYTAWSSWTECPKCGHGKSKRVRTCTNPPPINGGKDCNGPSKELKECQYRKCQDVGFSNWSIYGHCSKTCGGGAKMRRRSCTDKSKGCDGKYLELKRCNTHSCVLGGNIIYQPTPTSLCGFNPCKISQCLNHPSAMCVTSSNCKPVFFDNRGNILESCKGDSTVMASSPEIICENDPCKISGCYSDEASKCHVTMDCAPLFLDSKGKKLQCRGLLKVPPAMVCGIDPCSGGKACDLDVRCVSDYKCRPVYISQDDEIIDDCLGDKTKTEEGAQKKSSKAQKLKMIFQTSQDIKKMKTQLKELLNNNDKNSIEDNRDQGSNAIYEDINQLTADERNTLNQVTANERNTMSELTASGGNAMNEPTSSEAIDMNDASGSHHMMNEPNGRNAANEHTPTGEDTINEFTDNGGNTINELTANGEATIDQIQGNGEDTTAPNIGNEEATMNQISESVENYQNNQPEHSLEYRLQQFKKRNRFYRPKKIKKKSKTPS